MFRLACQTIAGGTKRKITAVNQQKEGGDMTTDRDLYKKGHLTARPGKDAGTKDISGGVRPLNLDSAKDGFLYVPKKYDSSRGASLALMLHGSGGRAEHGLAYLRDYADEQNILLVAPASRASSWEIITGESFDKDVIFIDQALSFVFENFTVDPAHVAIGGFSDGASYALCLGLSNGDLFTHVLAFSPGFQYTIERKGKPAVFVSHGIADRVLPIGPCSRRIVPQLEQQDYQVNYLEFDGAHEIPPNITRSGVEWFTQNGTGPHRTI